MARFQVKVYVPYSGETLVVTPTMILMDGDGNLETCWTTSHKYKDDVETMTLLDELEAENAILKAHKVYGINGRQYQGDDQLVQRVAQLEAENAKLKALVDAHAKKALVALLEEHT